MSHSGAEYIFEEMGGGGLKDRIVFIEKSATSFYRLKMLLRLLLDAWVQSHIFGGRS